MNVIRVNVPSRDLPATPLYRDFLAGKAGALDEALGGFGPGAPGWRTPSPASLDARLVAGLVEANTRLSVDAGIVARLGGLATGAVRAVVTGQQPGVAGGPLMSLYKIATACALAEDVERRTGTACVPVFWMGADDDDFAEIRELSVISRDTSLVSVSLPASATAPGRRVGDIAAGAVGDAFAAVRGFLPEGPVLDEVAAAATGAADLGEAAARTIVALTAGRIAIVDGRDPLLRTAARSLLLRCYDEESALREEIDRAGQALVAAGYHAQLEAGAGASLFYVEDGIRQRIPESRRDDIRRRIEDDITRTSPGVVARNLVQDAVFLPVAVVLGPAEIAYRAQLAGVYRRLGVARPVAFPRLSATFVPPAVASVVAAGAGDAARLAVDPAAWVERARAALEDAAFAGAAQQTEANLRALLTGFEAAARDRLDARAREKMVKRFADLEQRLHQALGAAVEQDTTSAAARWPFLARGAELFERDGVTQERFLSMVVPQAYHGSAAWDSIRGLASQHVEDALDGRVDHRVYSI